MIKKIISLTLVFLFFFLNLSYAGYIFFYGDGCPHCLEVEEYFEKNNSIEKYDIEMIETWKNRDGAVRLSEYMTSLNPNINDRGVPFLVLDNGENVGYMVWDKPIIDLFENHADKDIDTIFSKFKNVTNSENPNIDKEVLNWFQASPLGVLTMGALSDSINPCAFAVIIILLSSIISRYKDNRKGLYAGLAFTTAMFISYYLMGIWLYSAMASATNTLTLKIVVWCLGIFIGLLNLKDYFWYGKWFVMEVPLSWRPTMKRIINKAVSPTWAFFIGIIVSLFLLPCTAGPYVTVITYLKSANISDSWLYIYLIIYNLIFVAPMLFITFVVGLGYKKASEIGRIKEENAENIHLIVWILMLLLWVYVLYTAF